MDDLEELQKLIKEETEGKEEVKYVKGQDNKDVIRFIRKTGLGPGTNKVPTYVIYYAFIKWCKPHWARLWGKEEFFRTFKRHFEQKRSGNQRFYLINDAIELTEGFYQKAKKYDQARQKRKNSKK